MVKASHLNAKVILIYVRYFVVTGFVNVMLNWCFAFEGREI